MKYTYFILPLFLAATFNNACFDSKSIKVENGSSISEKFPHITMIEYFKEDFPNQEKIKFKVEYYCERQNWASVMVAPYIEAEFTAEPRWALFRKDKTVWNHVNWSKDIIFENDFELIDLPVRYSRIAKLIVEKYPGCPMDIFPENN